MLSMLIRLRYVRIGFTDFEMVRTKIMEDQQKNLKIKNWKYYPCQIQTELVVALNVTQQCISQRLKVLE